GRARLHGGLLAAARPGGAVLRRGRPARLRGDEAAARPRVARPERRAAPAVRYLLRPALRDDPDHVDRRGQPGGGRGREQAAGQVIDAVIEYVRLLMTGGAWWPARGA